MVLALPNGVDIRGIELENLPLVRELLGIPVVVKKDVALLSNVFFESYLRISAHRDHSFRSNVTGHFGAT